jgi:hypothetical protein
MNRLRFIRDHQPGHPSTSHPIFLANSWTNQLGWIHLQMVHLSIIFLGSHVMTEKKNVVFNDGWRLNC